MGFPPKQHTYHAGPRGKAEKGECRTATQIAQRTRRCLDPLRKLFGSATLETANCGGGLPKPLPPEILIKLDGPLFAEMSACRIVNPSTKH